MSLRALTTATQQRCKQNKARFTIYLCSLQGYPCGTQEKNRQKTREAQLSRRESPAMYLVAGRRSPKESLLFNSRVF
ncbi:hypothetical protein [Microcoleus vaginatus]|uniref:hypothetical protein n=1 Tax=Microcoleus vaginatus TaxID=119532 RepID=UPI00403F9BAF